MPESLRWPLLPHDDPPRTPPSTPPKSPRLDRRCKTRIERPLLPLRVPGSADELTLLGSLRSPPISIPCRLSPIASPPVLSRNATPSVLHQRHLGRVLRPSSNPCGRRLASSRGREPRTSRCPSLWPGDVRVDEVSVAAAGSDRSETRLDEPFAQTINAATKYVASSTPEQLDWNAELVRGDLGEAVLQLKRES